MAKISGYTIDESKIVKSAIDELGNTIIIIRNMENDYSYSLSGVKFGHYKTVATACKGYEIASELKLGWR